MRLWTGAWVCAGLLLACGRPGETNENVESATGAGTGGMMPVGAGSGGSAAPMTSGSGGKGMVMPPAGSSAVAGAGGMAGSTDVEDAAAPGMPDAGSVIPDAGGAAGSGPRTGPALVGPDPTSDSASTEGPLNVETISWTDFRDGPEFSGGTIWYPSDGTPPYPFLAVVPGFASFESSISGWGPFLASHGMVVITIDTNTTGDIPAIRAGALLDALESVKAENGRSGSPLMGKLDESRQALMGWSMGGGGTLIAAEGTPTLKAAISMCGWQPGGFFASMTVPTLMFASLGDPLAGGQSQGFYSSMPEDTPKMLIEAGVGDHFVANNPASLNGMIGRYGLSWMKVFLMEDDRYRQFLTEMPEGTTDFQTNFE